MKILLHICCSNCAIYPVKLFREEGHNIYGLWYNPNIHPLEEYTKRLESLKYLSDLWKIDVKYLCKEYDPSEYFRIIGYSHPPFPERCESCYRLRLEKAAIQAKKEGLDAFTTTLLISPYQAIDKIIKIGKDLSERYNIEFIGRDLREYFRNAMKISRKLGLYRQKYCGCTFSRIERGIETSNE